MKPTLFLLGPSDRDMQNSIARESVGQGRARVEFSMAGLLPILPFIEEDRLLNANSRSAILGVHRVARPRQNGFNVFNLVGDADSSAAMLSQVQSAVEQMGPSRCFNLPGNVIRTARGQLPKTLGGIPGCIVPRVEPADVSDYAELQAVCLDFDRWPLIVRSRGEHGGKEMLLLRDASQLEKHRDLPWLYSAGICLIEYRDYQGVDGLYQKNRVIVVDGVPYPRHALFSRQWLVHAGSRRELLASDIELVRREDHFMATQVQQYYPVFESMYRRIGLDIFGVDFAVVDDQVLVFEANACMKFLARTYRADNRFEYLDGHVKNLKRAIKKMLVQA